MKKLNNNEAKIISISGLCCVAAIATVPFMGPAVVTGVMAKLVWVSCGVGSAFILAEKE